MLRFFIILGLLLPVTTFAGEKLRVAVIDTGLDLDDSRFSNYLCEPDSHRDFTGEGINDSIGHGTHVAGIITKNASNYNKYCLIIIKYFSYNVENLDLVDSLVKAIKWAEIQNAKIINISSTGFKYSYDEYEAIKSAPDIKFIVAAGNQGNNLDKIKNKVYPASHVLPNIYVVGALDETGAKRSNISNYGSRVKYWQIGDNVFSALPDFCCRYLNAIYRYTCYGVMSGTSMATPAVTAIFVNDQ